MEIILFDTDTRFNVTGVFLLELDCPLLLNIRHDSTNDIISLLIIFSI